MEVIFERIKEFIVEEQWEYDFELTPETSLQDDLKIYGDDAYEILLKFCNKFKVTPKGFEISEYFKPEPDFTDIFRKKKIYKEFTLGSLIQAAESGVLL